MKSPMVRLGVLCLASALIAGVATSHQPTTHHVRTTAEPSTTNETPMKETALKVHYLEVVTPNVDETCEALAKAHGVSFGKPVPELGNARTADLSDGGRIGVRAPMHEQEKPVVRPYMLVDDLEGAIKSAEASGATIGVPAMPIPGQGTIAIYMLGGIEHGLWQR